jgi:hypothetical protein
LRGEEEMELRWEEMGVEGVGSSLGGLQELERAVERAVGRLEASLEGA